MNRNTNFIDRISSIARYRKFPVLFVFLLFSLTAYGQNPPQVTITQPINGTVFEGEQINVDYVVSGPAVSSARILIDDIPVRLLTFNEIKIGQNTVTLDVPARSCKVSIIARNEFGASLPAAVNLTRSERIFKPTLYVLAVGVSKYSNPDLELQFAAKDAIDFAEALLGQQGLLYEKVELKILTDRTANSENVRDGLQWLKTEPTYRDIAMLFMAGHGVNNNTGDFFFMPVNADVNRLSATCVGYTEIKGTIDAIAGKRLVFMDACHSGNVLGNSQQRAAMLTQAVNDLTGADNGAVVFTSSTGRQFSLENPEWSNGAFTKALVEGLTGGADLFDSKTITVNNLSSYVANRVKVLTKGQQAPTTIIPNSVPDFPVAVVNVNVLVENMNVTVLPSETANAKRPTTTDTGGKPATATPAIGMLVADGLKVLHLSRELTKEEIHGLMINTDALWVYNKGIKRNRNGNIWFVAGGVIFVGAVILDKQYGWGDAGSATGALFGMLPAVLVGTTFKLNARKLVRNSVDMYNSGIGKAGMELDFGFTGTGVGLALKF